MTDTDAPRTGRPALSVAAPPAPSGQAPPVAVDLGGDVDRVLVLVVAYEAATTIADVLDRVPVSVCGIDLDVRVVDDASTDGTDEVALAAVAATGRERVVVQRRPRNLGYGGTQIAGYLDAIDARYDAVALLHGDGQYPPEALDRLIEPLVDGRADVVFGSRMMAPGGALDGGMPLVRYVGNRVLSTVQNVVTGTRFTEWHSGFRAYRTDVLDRVGLRHLPTGFEFDSAVTLELVRLGARFEEFPIPTRYADEISRSRPFRTGPAILRHTLAHRLRRSTA